MSKDTRNSMLLKLEKSLDARLRLEAQTHDISKTELISRILLAHFQADSLELRLSAIGQRLESIERTLHEKR